ncbi:DNA recombination protein RmuC [Croceicoccus gelatinilyticus]|uniref:DNA recombination protein RmuC n=1 Tax=Croceicoccus gelatinilyticus TaxID=2835536 RepID=UPI001BD032E3|nr:DNA recombination protein RmuC [Croceicoccus gelatinilyticus]MBS7668906.1 DNA recombination protein RmuC [Croceicoccus gelatinilyticus]
MDILALVLVIVALVVGLGLGWYLGGRPVADWRERHGERDAEAKALDEKFRTAIAELATMSERADKAAALDEQLGEARLQLDGLRVQVAELNKDRANLIEREAMLKEAREELGKQFEAMGTKALEGAQARFLERANERFSESEKTNAEKIKALLDPVGARLKAYEDQVAALEEKRVKDFGSLSGVIEQMRLGQEQVRAEAARLGNSLRNAPKARGRWGEQQLKNVLETCGLSEHTDFMLEQSMTTDEGRLRPDAIVRIPGGKILVIDAKVSLNAYQDAYEADNEEARSTALDAHAKSMRSHVQALGTKSYQNQFEEAPDYVVMFVPGEHFVSAALEHDPQLWDYAFDNRVLLATPTNLVAIARTVAQVWRQDGLAKDAREIGELGAELHDRLAKVLEDLGKVGTHLGRAVNSFNDFGRSLESRVLVSARKLRDKNIEIGKREIEDVPLVEAAPRYGKEDVSGEPAEVSMLSVANDRKND